MGGGPLGEFVTARGLGKRPCESPHDCSRPRLLRLGVELGFFRSPLAWDSMLHVLEKVCLL